MPRAAEAQEHAEKAMLEDRAEDSWGRVKGLTESRQRRRAKAAEGKENSKDAKRDAERTCENSCSV